MIGKMNVDLSTCELLDGLEGHALLALGTSIFCEMPATAAGSLPSTEKRRTWEKLGRKGTPKALSGIGRRKLLQA